MASSTTSIALGAPSDLELANLGGIEALNLKVGPVRRNLFGPVDHRQLQQDFQRMLSMNVEVATKRWSFDFEGDRPTPGSATEWEALRCQDVPAFYRSCTVRHNAVVGVGFGRKGAPRRSESPESPAPSSDEGSPGSSSSSCGSGDEYLELATRRCYRLQRPIKRKQANITDFFRVKKRRLLHYKGSSRQ